MGFRGSYCYQETGTIDVVVVEVFFDQRPEGGLWSFQLHRDTPLEVATHFLLDDQNPIKVLNAVFLQVMN